jgi:hypothetical protein
MRADRVMVFSARVSMIFSDTNAANRSFVTTT